MRLLTDEEIRKLSQRRQVDREAVKGFLSKMGLESRKEKKVLALNYPYISRQTWAAINDGIKMASGRAVYYKEGKGVDTMR